MHDPVILTIVFIFGIAFGSFLNVAIYRLPLGKSLLKPRSSCPHCGAAIGVMENIPVVSYIMLRGRCSHCAAGISPRYLIVEILGGLLTAFAVYYFGLNVKGLETALLSLAFIAIFFIDLDHNIIPDFFTLPGVVIGFAVSLVPGAFVIWSQSLFGILIGAGAFFLIRIMGKMIFKKEALGLGDVKFAAMLAAFVGWQSLLLVLVLASLFGSVAGIALICLSGRGRKSYIPFGPFLVIGAWISIYFGDSIIRAYLDLVGL